MAAAKMDSLFDNAEEADGVKIASAYFTGTAGEPCAACPTASATRL